MYMLLYYYTPNYYKIRYKIVMGRGRVWQREAEPGQDIWSDYLPTYVPIQPPIITPSGSKVGGEGGGMC